MTIFVTLFGAVGPAVVYWYGGVLVIQGRLSIGAVVAFVAYLIGLYRPVTRLAGVYTSAPGGDGRLPAHRRLAGPHAGGARPAGRDGPRLRCAAKSSSTRDFATTPHPYPSPRPAGRGVGVRGGRPWTA